MGANNSRGWERIENSPEDPRFPSLQQGFNRRWFAPNIESVYLVYTPEGAREVVDDALGRYGAGTVKIISGGHCYEDFVFNSSVRAIIHMGQLQQYGHDDDKGYYLSSGDTNWHAFETLFRNYGKIVPGGSCYSVALGGHISGGGDGIMSRLHGLTVDWLTGVEVVVKPNKDKPAKLVYVHRDSPSPEERDLFWAHTGGGGGNFGVITRYYFAKLPDAPKGFVVSYIHIDMEQLTEQILTEVLDWYFELAKTVQWNTVGKFPLFHRSAAESVIYLYTSYTCDKECKEVKRLHWDLEQQLNAIAPTCEPTRILSGGHGGGAPFPLRAKKMHTDVESFISDDTIEYPTYALVQTMNASGQNQRGKYKSAYMCEQMPRDQISTIWKFINETPDGLTENDMTDSLVQLDIFGGKINEVQPSYTAIAQRRYVVKLQYQTYWQYPQDDELHLSWINDFYNAMYEKYGGVPDPDTEVPDGKGVFEGCYFNYPDVDLNKWKNGKYGALYLYFLGNLDRLISTKKVWDPEDFWSNSQSIPTQTLEEWKGGKANKH